MNSAKNDRLAGEKSKSNVYSVFSTQGQHDMLPLTTLKRYKTLLKVIPQICFALFINKDALLWDSMNN